jgi:hypothetical protein
LGGQDLSGISGILSREPQGHELALIEASGETSGKEGMKMLAIINALREHPTADFWGFWDELKDRARRKVTKERIARNGLTFAGAVSMCYVAVRIVQGVQGLVVYAY